MRTVGDIIVYEAPDSPKWKFAEADTCVRTFTGPYEDLLQAVPARGEPMSGTGDNMLVQDATLTRAKGNMGVLAVNLIGASPSSGFAGSGPLRVTVERDRVPVQKDLRTHPMFDSEEGEYPIDAAGWAKIDRWQNEPDPVLKGTFKYKDDSGVEQVLDDAQIAYAGRVLKGGQSYNLYAPIVRKTSVFSGDPGPGDEPGYREDPQVSVSFPDGYQWLKTACREIQQQDKSWQRTEEWTGAEEVDDEIYPQRQVSP